MMMQEIETNPEVKVAREQIAKTQSALTRAEEAVVQAQDREHDAITAAAQALAAGRPVRHRPPTNGHTLSRDVAVHKEASRLARENEQQALAKARKDALANLQPEFLEAVERLVETIEATTAANARVADLYAAATQLSNGRAPLPKLHWTELLPETAVRQSKLTTWQRQVESYLVTCSDARPKRRRVRLPKGK